MMKMNRAIAQMVIAILIARDEEMLDAVQGLISKNSVRYMYVIDR